MDALKAGETDLVLLAVESRSPGTAESIALGATKHTARVEMSTASGNECSGLIDTSRLKSSLWLSCCAAANGSLEAS